MIGSGLSLIGIWWPHIRRTRNCGQQWPVIACHPRCMLNYRRGRQTGMLRCQRIVHRITTVEWVHRAAHQVIICIVSCARRRHHCLYYLIRTCQVKSTAWPGQLAYLSALIHFDARWPLWIVRAFGCSVHCHALVFCCCWLTVHRNAATFVGNVRLFTNADLPVIKRLHTKTPTIWSTNSHRLFYYQFSGFSNFLPIQTRHSLVRAQAIGQRL